MADVEDKKAEEGLVVAGSSGDALDVRAPDDGSIITVGESNDALGTEKWVFAAFFAAAIGAAFLIGKVLGSAWNHLAEEPWVVRHAAFLLRYPEDERPLFTMSAGGVVGILLMIYWMRKESVRRWADDVALELSKVTWPKKETVTNGTIVVIAAGVFATVYIGLLDRLWGFVTMLVYGA
jgi:preprotein translocase subunit SecE